MTFLELEQKCKKRKILKILKFLMFLLLVILTAGFYYKMTVNVNNETKERNITAEKIKNVERKPEEKQAGKINKPDKNNEKLSLIIDLNVTEPQNESVKKPKKQQKKSKETSPVKEKKESSFIMSAKTLPSYNTCIALAEKYYKQGDYKEALKWAKNANVQNNKKPESWILSAKSLYKLGKRKEAIKVLKIYYNYRKDEKVKKLMGELNESN